MTKIVTLTFAFILGIFIMPFVVLAYISTTSLSDLQFTDPIVVTVTESK